MALLIAVICYWAATAHRHNSKPTLPLVLGLLVLVAVSVAAFVEVIAPRIGSGY